MRVCRYGKRSSGAAVAALRCGRSPGCANLRTTRRAAAADRRAMHRPAWPFAQPSERQPCRRLGRGALRTAQRRDSVGRRYVSASRADPALVAAASEVRAAIAAAATNPTGWATPDQLANRLDLPKTVKTLHLSIVAALDIAHVVRDTAADHPGLTAPARMIGMRAQGEAEIAIEQGETRYEGVTWTTPRQIAANQLIPLPEP